MKTMRTYRPWSKREEEALLKGVAKYGVGCWNDIKRDSDLYESLLNRSGVQIKDKWRNLVKFKLVKPEDFRPPDNCLTRTPRKKRKARSPSRSPNALPSNTDANTPCKPDPSLLYSAPELQAAKYAKRSDTHNNDTDNTISEIHDKDLQNTVCCENTTTTESQPREARHGDQLHNNSRQEGMNACEVQAAEEVIRLLLQSGKGSRLHVPEETLRACHPELQDLLAPYLGNDASTSKPCDDASTSPAASAMTSFSELMAAGTAPPGCLSLPCKPPNASPCTPTPVSDPAVHLSPPAAACASPSKPQSPPLQPQSPIKCSNQSAFISWTGSSTLNVNSTPERDGPRPSTTGAQVSAALSPVPSAQQALAVEPGSTNPPAPALEPPPLFSAAPSVPQQESLDTATVQQCAVLPNQLLGNPDMNSPVAIAILQLLALASGASAGAAGLHDPHDSNVPISQPFTHPTNN